MTVCTIPLSVLPHSSVPAVSATREHRPHKFPTSGQRRSVAKVHTNSRETEALPNRGLARALQPSRRPPPYPDLSPHHLQLTGLKTGFRISNSYTAQMIRSALSCIVALHSTSYQKPRPPKRVCVQFSLTWQSVGERQVSCLAPSFLEDPCEQNSSACTDWLCVLRCIVKKHGQRNKPGVQAATHATPRLSVTVCRLWQRLASQAAASRLPRRGAVLGGSS